MTAVSSANLIGMLLVWIGEQLCVKREKKRELRMLPCGVTVVIMRVKEIWSPILTSQDGLLLRKSIIKVHSEWCSPKLPSF